MPRNRTYVFKNYVYNVESNSLVLTDAASIAVWISVSGGGVDVVGTSAAPIAMTKTATGTYSVTFDQGAEQAWDAVVTLNGEALAAEPIVDEEGASQSGARLEPMPY
jgi:hypothetical protein